MRNTKSAFTLVELIVVITILAILGTIAFISLQGYSQEARNSKVTSDIRNLVTAIETDAARNGTQPNTLVSGDFTDNEVTGDFASGSQLSSADFYGVGNLNLAAIGQGSEDFTDPNADGDDYLYSAASTTGFSAYQLAGQIIDEGTTIARVQGNYFKKGSGDVEGLISASSDNTPLTNNASVGAGASIY